MGTQNLAASATAAVSKKRLRLEKNEPATATPRLKGEQDKVEDGEEEADKKPELSFVSSLFLSELSWPSLSHELCFVADTRAHALTFAGRRRPIRCKPICCRSCCRQGIHADPTSNSECTCPCVLKLSWLSVEVERICTKYIYVCKKLQFQR